MHKEFIEKIEELTKNFKETGEIDYLLHLESHIFVFLDSTIDDYLQEDL